MVDYTENTKRTEHNEIQLLIKQLDKHIEKDDNESSVIIRVGNSPKLLEMSRELFHSLEVILQGLSKGQSITVESHEKEIDVEEAAKIFFHLAPRHVEELLEKGEIAYREEGSEKLMKLGEVMRYDKKLRIEGRKALDEVVRLSEEMGLYDMENHMLKK